MKTLHLTNSWHESSGGVATFYRALMVAANRRGTLLRLVVPGERDGVEQHGEFAKVYHLQAPPALFNPSYRLIYPTQFLACGSKLQTILTAERPDVVEICDKYTLNYLGALLRLQLVGARDFRPVVIGLTCERMDDSFRSYLGKMPLAKAFCATYMHGCISLFSTITSPTPSTLRRNCVPPLKVTCYGGELGFATWVWTSLICRRAEDRARPGCGYSRS